MLSKAEKEKLVTQLLNEEKSQREISKIAKVSFSFISDIRKKQEGNISEPAVRIQAYKMYKDNKEPLEVAIAHHIDNVEAIKYWKEYLELTRHYRLLKIGEELGRNFEPFFNTYNAIKRRRLTLDDIQNGIKRARHIAIIDDELETKEKLSAELAEQIKEQKNIIANLKFEVQTLEVVKIIASKVVDSLAREKKRLEFISPYGAPRYGPEVNRYHIHVPWKPI